MKTEVYLDVQTVVRGNFWTYNQFHNILRLIDVLPSFPFTRGETMRDIITYKHGIYE